MEGNRCETDRVTVVNPDNSFRHNDCANLQRDVSSTTGSSNQTATERTEGTDSRQNPSTGIQCCSFEGDELQWGQRTQN